MLDGDMAKRTHDAALQERPEGLDGVGMNRAVNEGDPMVDGFMRHVVLQHAVAAPLMGVDNVNGVLVDVVRMNSKTLLSVKSRILTHLTTPAIARPSTPRMALDEWTTIPTRFSAPLEEETP